MDLDGGEVPGGVDPSRGAVFARFGAQAVWRVIGDAALTFLHDVLSQDVASLAAGEGALAALLTEKGRVRAVLRVLAAPEGAYLVGEPASAAGITDGIARVAPLAGVETADESERRRLVRVVGRRAEEAIGEPLPEREHAWVDLGGAMAVRTAWGGEGADLLVEARYEREWCERLAAGGAIEVSPAGLEPLRIGAGRPAFGIDVTEDTLVNETPLLERAVSAAKGCYPGQESVARVRDLGSARRRLALLRISGPAPGAGSPVVSEGSEAGRVTSAAPTPEGAVALAVIRSEIPPGARVSAGGSPATVGSYG